MSVGELITWPYKAGDRSRRGSPKAGTTVQGDICAGVPPVLIGSVVPMLWTFLLAACVSAVTFNAKRAADDFLLNAQSTIV